MSMGLKICDGDFDIVMTMMAPDYNFYCMIIRNFLISWKVKDARDK